MRPALTLITSVLNGREHLDAMLASAPAHPAVEHLVIDGGSTDGTLERLRAVPHLRLIERPGLSLYEAWNEALRDAAADHVLFLNADDELPPGTLDALLSALPETAGGALLYGEAEAFVGPGHGHAARQTVWSYRGEALTGPALPGLLFGAALINAKIFPRQQLLDACRFDTRFRISADRDLLLRLVLLHRGMRWIRLPRLLYRYRIHPGSMTLQPTRQTRLEMGREHLAIAARFGADPHAGADVRRMLRIWAAHERAVQLVRGLQAGQGKAIAGALPDLLRSPATALRLAAARRMRRAYRAALRAAAP